MNKKFKKIISDYRTSRAVLAARTIKKLTKIGVEKGSIIEDDMGHQYFIELIRICPLRGPVLYCARIGKLGKPIKTYRQLTAFEKIIR